MLKYIGLGLALAVLQTPLNSAVAADADVTVREQRTVVKHRHYRQRAYYGCPDGYGCYPLYGAYGPYGGTAYWSSFSYLVPSYNGPRP